ncbi:MAG: hypothetical protein ACFFDN_30075, partial [Candidatus Hodarchaeota archaeon]
IAAGDISGNIKIWNVNDESEIISCESFPKEIITLSWFPDGKKIITSFIDGLVLISDALTGSKITAFPARGAVSNIFISNSSNELILFDRTGYLYKLEVIGLKLEDPVVTPVMLYDIKTDSYEKTPSVRCQECKTKFNFKTKDFEKFMGFIQGNIPQFLLSCPKCEKNHVVNPFFVENGDLNKNPPELIKKYKNSLISLIKPKILSSNEATQLENLYKPPEKIKRARKYKKDFLQNGINKLLKLKLSHEIENTLLDFHYIEEKCEDGLIDDLIIEVNKVIKWKSSENQNFSKFEELYNFLKNKYYELNKFPDQAFQIAINYQNNSIPYNLANDFINTGKNTFPYFYWINKNDEIYQDNSTFTFNVSPTVHLLKISPNGNFLIVASQNLNLSIWNLKSGTKVCSHYFSELEAEENVFIREIQWSPDEGLIALKFSNEMFKILKTEDLTEYHLGKNLHHRKVNMFAWHPKGKKLFILFENDFYEIRDFLNKVVFWPKYGDRFDSYEAEMVSWTLNGDYFFSLHEDGKLQFYKANNMQFVKRISLKDINDSNLSYHYSGKKLRSGNKKYIYHIRECEYKISDFDFNSHYGMMVLIYELETGELISNHLLKNHNIEAILPNNKEFLLSNALLILDLITQKPIYQLKGLHSRIWRIDISSKGKKIAAAIRDGIIKIWNSPFDPIKDETRIKKIEYLDSEEYSKYPYSTSLKSLQFDILERPFLNYCEFHPSGNIITAIKDYEQKLSFIELISLSNFETISRFSVRRTVSHRDAQAWSPDGNTLICSDYHDNIQVWRFASAPPLLTLSKRFIGSFKWHPDGSCFFSRFNSNKIIMIDAVTLETIQTFEIPIDDREYISDIDISPDGRRLLIHIKNKIIIWDITKNIQLHSIVEDNEIFHCFWSPDGTRITINGQTGTFFHEERISWIRDANNYDIIREFKGILIFRWLPDCTHLLVRTKNLSLGIYNLKENAVIAETKNIKSVISADFLQNGKYFLVGDGYASICLLTLENYQFGIPYVTPVYMFNSLAKNWDKTPSVRCEWCLKRFHINIRDSSTNEYYYESGTTHYIECPYCKKMLKLNSFIVDNRNSRDNS